MVEEVELLDCNPQYAYVRLPSGREETVSVRQLAPVSNADNENFEDPPHSTDQNPLEPPRSECPEDISQMLQSHDIPNLPVTSPPIESNSTDTCIHPLAIEQQRTRPYCLRNKEICTL